MNWMEALKESLDFMESHMLEDFTAEDVAKDVYLSSFQYQKGFKILTGYSVGEYVRNRRLYLAALELRNSNGKVIDLSYKYGYETPESFSKAFARFHGLSPKQIRKHPDRIQLFQPLTVKIIMEGGTKMDVRIEKKEGFKIVGKERKFTFDNAFSEVPKFWDEFSAMSKCNMKDNNIGKYGVCIDGLEGETEFRYLIAGDYNGEEKCDGATIVEIPAFTWAIFKCVGPMPGAIQDVNTRIFKEWLPGNKEYEVAAGYNIENYSMGDCSAGDYVSEIWIPVKKK